MDKLRFRTEIRFSSTALNVLPEVVPGDAGSPPAAASAVPPVVHARPVPLLVSRKEPRVVAVLVVAVHVGRLAVAEPREARLELLVDDALHVLVRLLRRPLRRHPLRPYPLRALRAAALDLKDNKTL